VSRLLHRWPVTVAFAVLMVLALLVQVVLL
jgi:hypothetical protein